MRRPLTHPSPAMARRKADPERRPKEMIDVGTRQTRPAPKRFRPARRCDALCDHRRVAGHLVRTAAAACADGAARGQRAPMGLSIRREPQLHPALRRRCFVPRTARARGRAPANSQAIDQVTCFLARPDRRHSFADWLRMLLEEMLVIDAASLYPRYNRGGSLYALDNIDGATIKPLIGEDGRT